MCKASSILSHSQFPRNPAQLRHESVKYRDYLFFVQTPEGPLRHVCGHTNHYTTIVHIFLKSPRRRPGFDSRCGSIIFTDFPVAFWYVQGHRNGRSWVRTSVGTGGSSKTATGMAYFSIMWQGPPTMADEAFPGC